MIGGGGGLITSAGHSSKPGRNAGMLTPEEWEDGGVALLPKEEDMVGVFGVFLARVSGGNWRRR